MDRRTYLLTAGTAGIAIIAGCTEEGDDGTEPTEDDDGTADDGGSDDGGTDEDTDGTEPSGDEDDGTDGEDDQDDDDSDDEDEQDGENDEQDGEDDDDSDSDDDQTTDDQRLRDVFTLEQSYVMELELPDGTGTWRFHEGDFYVRGEFGGEESEIYRIRTDSGVETYTVVDGTCIRGSSSMQPDFDPEQPEQDEQEYVAQGTTTIDGEEVHIFEITGGTYYVSVETGYPVRFEGEDGTVANFHSWGDTEPITPPEMECIER